MKYKVVERFVSINGEGRRAGELAVFIRLAGCNLRCSYCDTLWATDENAPHEEMTADEIVDYIDSTGIDNITLTGGEPLCHSDIGMLIEAITENKNHHLEIETNGSISIEPFQMEGKNLSFTVDYKSPSSMMSDRMIDKNYGLVSKHDTVKFVVGSFSDLKAAYGIINAYDLLNRTQVYFSPIFGEIEAKDIVSFMEKYKLNGARLQLQLHKYIWDPNKKGV